MKTAKILIVDDVADNIELLIDVLKDRPYQLLAANSGLRAIEIAKNNTPELILLDVMMPDIDGFATCERLKQDPDTSHIPVIFVTAKADQVSTGFSVGGCDYIPKPINADEVIIRIQYHLERTAMLNTLEHQNDILETKVRERTAELTLTNKQLRDEINERRYIQDRLNYLASHDFVTHINNRASLENHVAETLVKVQLGTVSSVYILIDINQFRLVNESCGYIAGDELLRDFANLVSGNLSKGDFFARLGGDKFAVVTFSNAIDYGAKLAARIQRQLDHFTFEWDEYDFPIKASIATVVMDNTIVSFDQLMIMADEVAFFAKKEGGNSVFDYQKSLNKITQDKKSKSWALKLVESLKNDDFKVYFQKIIKNEDSINNAKVSIEVLIRLWDYQYNRLVFPDEFIPQAERFHIIADIDKWVIKQVIVFFANNSNILNTLNKININISAITLQDTELPVYIETLFEEYKIPASQFTFEITETQAISNIGLATTFVDTIHKIGSAVALDDFGTGYSSFNYLLEVPFDMLKIDGVFIRDIDWQNSHFNMVKSMCDVANDLNIPVVAEFVENEQVLDVLKSLNIDYLQGYHFHQPEELTAIAFDKHI